jgi:putative transcriptional regulator
MENAELKTPILLLAMPQVQDPFFHKSVVLLLEHQDEGSLGFIVNRPTQVKVSEILEDLEIPWAGQDGALAYFGGPVEPQQGTLLYRAEEAEEDDEDDEASRIVFPGVALSQHVGDLKALAEHPPESLRLLLGYAGWGEGQLMTEILRNDWLVAPPNLDLIFGEDGDVWNRAVASIGVNPEQLPSWTGGENEPAAN